MKRLGLVCDDIALLHEEPAFHPERRERFLAIRRMLDLDFTTAVRVPTRPADRKDLLAAHDEGYLDALERIRDQSGHLDADTYFSRGSYRAALAAAGGVTDLVMRALTGEFECGFAAVRPPGHHATRDRAMGFCLLNHVAVAAKKARAAGVGRIAIVDWDVHHGNGTQEIFWNDASVLYVSTHELPGYPGTGCADDVGDGAGRGYTVNVPLPAGQGDADYGYVFANVVFPAIRAFAPELVLISAGFDAHAEDPLAHMKLSAEGFAALTAGLVRAAGPAPIVGVLEGGYHLEALVSSTKAVLEVLIGRREPRLSYGAPSEGARAAVHETRRALLGTDLSHSPLWAKVTERS